jgi:hypothetical protein
MAKALLINREDLVKRTPLSGNIDLDKIIHYIEIAQDLHIESLIGTKLIERIKTDIVGASLSGVYETLVVDYIKPVLVQYTFLEFLPFAQYTLGNKGIFKHTSEASSVPTVEEIDRMKEAARDTAQHYAKRLNDYLEHNSETYPEFLANVEEDIRPNRNPLFGGWDI